MHIETYIETLKNQIRDAHAKEFVAREIMGHIEDQAKDYRDAGMDADTALQKAVTEMGDPVSVGVDLDRIHRPHMEWKFLLFVMLISTLSIVMHFLINRGMQTYPSTAVAGSVSRSDLLSVVAGLAAMLLVYRLDYTILAGRCRLLGGIYLAVCFLANRLLGTGINGRPAIRLGVALISPHVPMLFYLVLFAGILYEYRGKERFILLKIAAWMLAPVICMLLSAYGSLSFCCFLLTAEILLFFLAFRRNWYPGKTRTLLIGSLTAVVLIAIYCTLRLRHLAGYQSARIQNWLAGLGILHLPTDDNGIHYINSRLSKVFRISHLLSKNDTAVGIMTELPGSRSDYVLGSVAANCGMLPLAVVIAVLLLLSVYVFRISLKQKNSLGFIIGCACGITIGLQSLLNLLIVFGILPDADTTLPLFSSGMSYRLAHYILLGLILSIYRYKDIRNEKTMQSIRQTTE